MSNKDEALRARDIAEDWMRKSDFTTARRVALKAQKMDETLENISQMIMVCDVHCAVSEKAGDETDWYKILQVAQNADDNAIKKQYRKLALHLHPDKNKLPGAESAFKTIGEAQRILLDTGTRRSHDMKRKSFRAPSYQPRQPSPAATAWSFQSKPVFQPVHTARNSFTTGFRPETQQKPQPPQPRQPAGFSADLNFWTTCPFCQMKHEYLREYINKLMICPTCRRQFVALQTAFPGPQAQATSFPFVQQSGVPTQETGKAAEKQAENSVRAKSSSSSAEKFNGKRKRKNVVVSSGSLSSENSCEWEEVATGGQHSRRSVRSKQNVSYKEKMSDDEDKEEGAGFRKKAEENHMFAETMRNGINRKNKVKDSGSSGSASDSEIVECADPDFTNFEKSREETCFKAGQIWAMYDEMGQMPRYYAMIRKVLRKSGFMLKMTWLEARPDDEKAKQWVRKKLPVSTGKFELGEDQNTNKTSLFSHLIHCSVRGPEDTISVYPRRGETWALFKNWDINWSSSGRRRHHEFEYVFVEVLSEYAEGAATEVAILRKVKGFASVFCRRIASGTVQIPPNEFLRFSHGIPSTKLTGKEREGVPVNSYELDTAALPQKIDEEEEEEEEAIPVLRKAAKSNQVRSSSEPDCIVIPSFQFHDFSSERSEGKFAKGQIWSMNSEEDGLPKYYAKIQKAEWKPVFKLQIRRLVLESLPANVIQWQDKKMPVSCGNFTLKEGQDETLTKATGFSHEIKPQQHPRSKTYVVLPKTGEIWAMYRNWSDAAIKAASLKKCEYEVVEVIDDNESYIEVMVLERVKEFISVFKEKVEGGLDVKRKVRRQELLRFSHFVPAFRLTGERDGALRGYVELDPKALSRNLRRPS